MAACCGGRAKASVWARNKQGTTHLTSDFQGFIFKDSRRYSNVDDCADGRVSVYSLVLQFFLSDIEKRHLWRQEAPDRNRENRLSASVLAAYGFIINRAGGPDGQGLIGQQIRCRLGGRE